MISRWLLVAALALGAVGLALVGQQPHVNAGAAAADAPVKLKFSKHAEQRLKERRVKREDVESLVAGGQNGFAYLHNGRAERGYYDAKTGLFVAAGQDGTIITVIAGATPRYVEKLKRAK